MKFLSTLNIYKRLNSGELNIGKISIIGGVFIVLFDSFLSPLFSNIILNFSLKFISKQTELYNIMIFIGEFIGATLALYFVYIFLSKINRCNPTPGARSTPNGFYYCALLIIGLRIMFEGSIGHITKLIPMPESIVTAFEQMSISPIYLILSVCVFAPFIEEFMYRGILLNGFLRKYKPKTAILLSALFFAIAHMNIPQGINAFLLGLVLGIVYYKTRSLYLCIFMHFINNLCAQFIFLIPLSTIFIVIQSIIYVIIGSYLIYTSLKGLKILI